MAESVRELIAQNIVDVLGDMRDPQLVKVTREPFNVEELAITQFPAALINTGLETRESVSMGGAATGIREGVINYDIRAYVRGNELDSRRNAIVESIEEALDADRNRDQGVYSVLDSSVVQVEVIQRQAPLAEVSIQYQVVYVFKRGTA
jgi:hypothetical protein